MKVKLEFEECIKDSPHFRESVHHSEIEIAELENQLDRMTKTCSAMIDAGRTYSNVSRVFVSSLDDLAKVSKHDVFVQSTLKQFSTTMGEISNFHSMLFDHAQRSVKNELVTFLKEDVKGARDSKKLFDKSSDDYSSYLSKYAAVNKLKPNEIDDATNHMTTSRNNFRHVAMDYVVQINMLQKKNRFQTLEKLLSHMHALSTFFHQGYNLMKDLDPFLKSLSTQLSDIRQSAQREYTVMSSEEGRYMKMTGDSGLHMRHEKEQLVIEGHLFKRASNAFKTWHRRWFTIKDNKLFYQKRKDDMTVAVDDVRLCTVRATDDGERRFCFEVISPGKSFLLQGDSEEVREAWISAIQSSIGAAYKNTSVPSTSEPLQQVPATVVNKPLTSVAISRASSNSSLLSNEGPTEKEDGGVQGAKSTTSFLEEGHHSIIATLNQVPGNRMCADCKRSDPRWASISLGATLCIDCSGVHRSLGVHVSKVRSLTLDQWEPEVVKIMVGLGNTRLNEIYEANLPAEDKIKANCSNKDRQVFIKAKYVDRKYVMTLPTSPTTSACGSQGQKLNRWTVSKRRTKKKRSSDTKTDGVGGDVTEVDTELEETVNDVLIFGGVVSDNKLQDFDDKDIYDVSQLTPDLLFYKAAEAANLPVMMLAACNGASPNCSNDKDGGKAPLMASAAVGSIQVCEYLLLNGAKINAKDDLGRTALHYVSLHNRTGVACQLLKRRVDLDAVDASGKTALEIAIEDANADIVTLIRLKKMSNQMKEDDASSFQQSDDLVNDVFRDFTRRATSEPHSPQPTDSTFNILSAPSWNNKSTPSNASPADGADANKKNKQSGTSDQSSITLADVTSDCEPVESSV